MSGLYSQRAVGCLLDYSVRAGKHGRISKETKFSTETTKEMSTYPITQYRIATAQQRRKLSGHILPFPTYSSSFN